MIKFTKEKRPALKGFKNVIIFTFKSENTESFIHPVKRTKVSGLTKIDFEYDIEDQTLSAKGMSYGFEMNFGKFVPSSKSLINELNKMSDKERRNLFTFSDNKDISEGQKPFHKFYLILSQRVSDIFADMIFPVLAEKI